MSHCPMSVPGVLPDFEGRALITEGDKEEVALHLELQELGHKEGHEQKGGPRMIIAG